MRDDDLGQLYRDAIDRVPVRGHLDAGEARIAAHGRTRRRRGTAAAVLTAAALVTVMSALPHVRGADDLVANPSPAPATATAVTDPLMVIEPTAAAPGSLVVLRFPTEHPRGTAFQLESAQPSGWVLEYYTIAGQGGEDPGSRSWFRPTDLGGGFSEVGIEGPGGEKVRIPDIAAPGEYRLCTANALVQACAPLSIN